MQMPADHPHGNTLIVSGTVTRTTLDRRQHQHIKDRVLTDWIGGVAHSRFLHSVGGAERQPAASKTSNPSRVRCPCAGSLNLSEPRPRPSLAARGHYLHCPSCSAGRRYGPPASQPARAAARVAHTNPSQRSPTPAACRASIATHTLTSPPSSRSSSPTDHGPRNSENNNTPNSARSTHANPTSSAPLR